MRRIRFTIPAAADLADILDHISTSNPAGAANVRRRIERSLRHIAEWPEAAPVARNLPGMRRAFAIPYPYAIDYEFTNDDIVVHGVRHTARKPLPS